MIKPKAKTKRISSRVHISLVLAVILVFSLFFGSALSVSAATGDFRDVVCQCTTDVAGTANRLNNVTLAAQAVNGYVVQPGAEFSFNRVVGQRTEAKGYKPAPAFSDGKVIEAIGGGVCQVSSTIYASIKDYGFKITERWVHSLPVTYLPPGYDATVNYGSADFRFVNNRAYPIRIDAVVKNRVLTVKIMGTIPGKEPEKPPVVDLTVPCDPTAATVLVNGEQVAFDAYTIGGNNYFKLRDIAFVLAGTEKQFEVGYDTQTYAVLLMSGLPYTPVGGEMAGQGTAKRALPSNDKILLDGEKTDITAYKINNNNYFKLRDLGAALHFGVDWDATDWTILIDTSKDYTPEGLDGYLSDLDLSGLDLSGLDLTDPDLAGVDPSDLVLDVDLSGTGEI